MPNARPALLRDPEPRGNPLAALAADTIGAAALKAGPAMGAARAAGLNATVTPLVEEFGAALRAADTLATTTMRRAEQLAKDDTSDSRGLDQSWAEMRSAYESAAGTIRGRLREAAETIERLLYAEALPRSRSDSAALLARQDVAAVLEAADRERVGEVAIELARQGGEHAAALASPWGRGLLDKLGGGPALHESVVAGGIEAKLRDESGPGQAGRRYAEAFLAVGGLSEARGLVETALYTAERDLGGGRDGQSLSGREARGMHASRHRDTSDRHADLRQLAEAGASDAA